MGAGGVGEGDLRESFFFWKEAKGYVLSFGANERTKENIHPHQGLPLYWEDANRELQKPPILCGFWQGGTTPYIF